jgi:hypothetical protein
MQRGIGTLGILGIAVGTGLAAPAAGCAASGDESIIVLRNVVPASGCVLSSTTTVSISQGALDVQAHTGYVFSAQLKSRITTVPGSMMDDQRTIFVDGANVDIAFPGSALFSDAELASLKSSGFTHFKAEFSTLLPPNGGVAAVGFELIPAGLVAMIAAKPGFISVAADTSFTVLGQLAGGDVTSQTFHYPVTILSGGLVNFAGTTGNCADLSSSFMPRAGNPCNPGQDTVVDCCKDAKGNVCPAVGTMIKP